MTGGRGADTYETVQEAPSTPHAPRSLPPTIMAYSDLARKAGLKLFEKHLKQYEPVDPLYETYTDNKGRQKRRKVRPTATALGGFICSLASLTDHSPLPA
jgi:hypothetical protein